MSWVGPIRAQEEVAILASPQGSCQGLRPTSRSLKFKGGNESAKHNCSEWNQRNEELGRPGLAPRSPGAGGYSCGKLQALGSGWSPCILHAMATVNDGGGKESHLVLWSLLPLLFWVQPLCPGVRDVSPPPACLYRCSCWPPG